MVRIISTAGFRSYNGTRYYSDLLPTMEGHADTVMEASGGARVDLRSSNSGRKAEVNKSAKAQEKRKQKRLALMRQYEEERAKRAAESGALNREDLQSGGQRGRPGKVGRKHKGKS